MRVFLCKNVLAVGDFRSAICLATWKKPVLELQLRFQFFRKFFSDFLLFWKGIPVGISQRGEEKGCQIYFFSSSDWHEGNSCPLDDIKLAVPGKFLFSGWHKNDCSRETDPEDHGFFGGSETNSFQFFLRPLKKYSPSMDRFFCVSIGFSRCMTVVQPVSSCVQLQVPLRVHVLLFRVHVCARTHARAKYIMQGCSRPFPEWSEKHALQHVIFQALIKIFKNFFKKECDKSCRIGKSAYLCNRFREGEPLRMTDW